MNNAFMKRQRVSTKNADDKSPFYFKRLPNNTGTVTVLITSQNLKVRPLLKKPNTSDRTWRTQTTTDLEASITEV